MHRLEHSKNVTEFGSLLGLCGVFCHFVSNFARVIALLKQNLRKGQLQTFYGLTDDEISALETAQERSNEPTVLALPYWQGAFSADTDACNKKIGFILFQKQSVVPTGQLDICLVLLSTLSAHTIPDISTVLMWSRQDCFCGLTLRIVDLG